MKKLLTSLLVLIIFLGGGLFALQKNAPEVLEEYASPISDLIDFVDDLVSEDDYAEEAVVVLENSNPASEIGLIATIPGKEGMLVMRQPGTETITKLFLYSPDGKKAEITPNEQGLAALYKEGGNVIQYNNYTENTVDITITTNDGQVKELKAYELSQNKQLIPLALAGNGIRVNSSLLLNSASCATGIVGSPTAIISCPILVLRIGGLVVTQFVDIPGCEGEELGECAIRHNSEYSEQKIMAGIIQNNANQKPVNKARIALINHLNKELRRVYTNETGSYAMPITGGIAKYTLQVAAEGYTDRFFNLVESGPALRVLDESGTIVSDQELGPHRNYTLKFNINLAPDGIIRGEVIDAKTGMGINNAQLNISPLGTSTSTDRAGEYVLFPKVTQAETSISLSVTAEEYIPQSLSLKLTADLRGDEYIVYNGTSIFNGIVKLAPVEEEEKDDEEDKDDEQDPEAPPPPEPQDESEDEDKDKEKTEKSCEEKGGRIMPDGICMMGMGEFLGQFNQDPEEKGGTYTVPLEFDFFNVGITNKGTGSLTLVLSTKGSSCEFTLQGNASGVPDISHFDVPAGITLPSITGQYSGHATNCSGTFNETSGKFSLSGSHPAEISFSFMDTTQALDVTESFQIEGKLENDKVSGILYIDPSTQIPFGMTIAAGKYDGNWSGVTVDTSATEGCIGGSFGFWVRNNVISGEISGTINDNGSFTASTPDGTNFSGEIRTSYGDGTFQATNSSCKGTFAIKKL